MFYFLVLANGFFVRLSLLWWACGARGSKRSRRRATARAAARSIAGQFECLYFGHPAGNHDGFTGPRLDWRAVFAHLLEAPLNGVVSEVTLHTISFAVAFTVITFLHIVLGELAPKTFALERTERVALAISLPMETFYRVFYWPIRFLDWAGTRTVRLFGLHPTSEHASVYTPAELRLLVDISQRSGHLQPEQRQLLDRAFEFTDLSVREAMIPRTQMVAVPVDATLEQLRSTFLATGFSRLPVYRVRSDDMVGCLPERSRHGPGQR